MREVIPYMHFKVERLSGVTTSAKKPEIDVIEQSWGFHGYIGN